MYISGIKNTGNKLSYTSFNHIKLKKASNDFFDNTGVEDGLVHIEHDECKTQEVIVEIKARFDEDVVTLLHAYTLREMILKLENINKYIGNSKYYSQIKISDLIKRSFVNNQNNGLCDNIMRLIRLDLLQIHHGLQAKNALSYI